MDLNKIEAVFFDRISSPGCLMVERENGPDEFMSDLRRDIFENGLKLPHHQCGLQNVNLPDPARILDRKQCNDGHPVDVPLMECFEVGLDTRSPGRIGTGDG